MAKRRLIEFLSRKSIDSKRSRFIALVDALETGKCDASEAAMLAVLAQTERAIATQIKFVGERNMRPYKRFENWSR